MSRNKSWEIMRFITFDMTAVRSQRQWLGTQLPKISTNVMLFHAYGQTDMSKLIVAFLQFCEVPKNK